jgi:hypothetical protein
MLHPPAIAHSLQIRAPFPAVRIADGGPQAGRLVDPAHLRKASRTSLLAGYLEGWAEANLSKILGATAPGYRFHDPFVGSFSRRSLREYFAILRDRLSRAGAVRRPDIAFLLRGPVDRPTGRRGLQFWREAPRIGLTGVSRIEVGDRGIIAESVAYDLNLASDMLCCASR